MGAELSSEAQKAALRNGPRGQEARISHQGLAEIPSTGTRGNQTKPLAFHLLWEITLADRQVIQCLMLRELHLIFKTSYQKILFLLQVKENQTQRGVSETRGHSHGRQAQGAAGCRPAWFRASGFYLHILSRCAGIWVNSLILSLIVSGPSSSFQPPPSSFTRFRTVFCPALLLQYHFCLL